MKELGFILAVFLLAWIFSAPHDHIALLGNAWEGLLRGMAKLG